jgi:TonB family protein
LGGSNQITSTYIFFSMPIKTLTLLFLNLLFSASFAFAQRPAEGYLFEVRGHVTDTEGKPFNAVSLSFDSDNFNGSAFSQEDGRFSVKLPEGKYRIHIHEAESASFNAFIEISKKGPNPTDFTLVIELNQNWCANCAAGKMPEVVKYVAPTYPVTAMAVGAVGLVVVEIKIDASGKVIDANAVSGHPLLKQVSARAAKQWLFSPDPSLPERAGKLLFSFDVVSKSAVLPKFRKPNLMEVFVFNDIVDTVSTVDH